MNERIASLSMYDWPEVCGAIDRLWAAIQEQLHSRGIEAPVSLSRDQDVLALWRNPNLIIGQTCGWPYANKLRDAVVPFARFDYGLDGCPPGHYNSVFIGSDPDHVELLSDARALMSADAIAINSDDSQSGFQVFGEILKAFPTDCLKEAQLVVTGAHRNSARAVANGEAQIAAIDAVAFELAKQFEPEAVKQVHVLGASEPKPGLPLITSMANRHLSGQLLDAVIAAVDGLDEATKSELHIKSVIPAGDEDYLVFKKA